MPRSGAQAMLDMLADAGVRYVFGNPGTTELPLLDCLVDDHRFQFILGLQEVPIVGMADGYAQASRSLGVLNLHISCGLGNGMGMIYNAYRAGTPLLVTVGQQDRRLAFEEPILWSDMVGVVAPWTKLAIEVQQLADLPSAMRRAMQAALAPPTGPVFLSVPMDLQLELGELDTTPAAPLDTRIRPPAEAIARAAQVLASARNPAILVGSRIVEREAVAELVAVAERLGSPVMSESGTTHGRLGFPADHHLAALGMPLWSPQVRQRLAPHDVILVVGMDLLRQYVYHEPARAIPEHVEIVHLDEDPWQIGKNYPVSVGVWGDSKTGLAELAALLDRAMSDEQKAAAQARAAKWSAEHEQARADLRRTAAAERDRRPMTPLTLMSTVADLLPGNAAVVEEAVTTTSTYLERLAALRNTTGYFGHRGWSLGWGLGCAMGVQLAWPERPVLALLGEGAAMYGIQGLWTAAHYNLPVTFLICNNGQYQILKAGAKQLGLPAASRGQFVGMDIADPEVDFVSLSRSLGVDAYRVTEPEELRERLRKGLSGDRPLLIDAPVERPDMPALRYG